MAGRHGTEIYEALGMSECSTYISGSPARPAPPGALGYPQNGRRVTVLGGDEGILAIHRDDPGLMLGYLGPDGPELPLQGDWFVTGDRVARAQDGAITYLGRDDDMMNAGGFRVSPLEVERALADHPEIDDIAVTDVEIRPDVRVIAAFYTGATLDRRPRSWPLQPRGWRVTSSRDSTGMCQPAARGQWQTFPARAARTVQGRP